MKTVNLAAKETNFAINQRAPSNGRSQNDPGENEVTSSNTKNEPGSSLQRVNLPSNLATQAKSPHFQTLSKENENLRSRILGSPSEQNVQQALQTCPFQNFGVNQTRIQRGYQVYRFQNQCQSKTPLTEMFRLEIQIYRKIYFPTLPKNRVKAAQGGLFTIK